MYFEEIGKAPRLKNCYTIYATGYFGDMDEKFHWDQTCKTEDQALVNAAMLTKLLRENNKGPNQLEVDKDMIAWLEEVGITEGEVDRIPRDNCAWEYLPVVEELKILYHNSHGVPYEQVVRGHDSPRIGWPK